MMQSFFVQSVLNVDENGLFISVDLEKTNQALNELVTSICSEGFTIESIAPVISGVGQFQYGEVNKKGIGLAKWFKQPIGTYGYGFGYSYTSGFIVLAGKKLKKAR